ncbi:MAG: SUMF1/EgtB/PvdO family nonheme iron enzyme [Magnetococcales bacterium]|nr:SUMF1/EgtB/PvdO family nonheme iron enzyme [Magnetococcales bacterium]
MGDASNEEFRYRHGHHHELPRGGSWNNPAAHLRAAMRNRNHADNRNDNLGFRVAAPANT